MAIPDQVATAPESRQLRAIMIRQEVEPQWWTLNEETAADVVDTLEDLQSLACRKLPMQVLLRMIQANDAAVVIVEARDKANIGAIGLVRKLRLDGKAMLTCELEVRASIDPAVVEVFADKLEVTARTDTGFGLCQTIHIASVGAFPVPRGYEYEPIDDDVRAMVRQLGTTH